MDFPFYFQIMLGQWKGVILEIPYGCFRVVSPFLPNKHRQGGFFFRFKNGPSKLIPFKRSHKALHVLHTLYSSCAIPLTGAYYIGEEGWTCFSV